MAKKIKIVCSERNETKLWWLTIIMGSSYPLKFEWNRFDTKKKKNYEKSAMLPSEIDQ